MISEREATVGGGSARPCYNNIGGTKMISERETTVGGGSVRPCYNNIGGTKTMGKKKCDLLTHGYRVVVQSMGVRYQMVQCVRLGQQLFNLNGNGRLNVTFIDKTIFQCLYSFNIVAAHSDPDFQ